MNLSCCPLPYPPKKKACRARQREATAEQRSLERQQLAGNVDKILINPSLSIGGASLGLVRNHHFARRTPLINVDQHGVSIVLRESTVLGLPKPVHFSGPGTESLENPVPTSLAQDGAVRPEMERGAKGPSLSSAPQPGTWQTRHTHTQATKLASKRANKKHASAQTGCAWQKQRKHTQMRNQANVHKQTSQQANS